MYTPVLPQFYYIKVRFKGVKIIWWSILLSVDVAKIVLDESQTV